MLPFSAMLPSAFQCGFAIPVKYWVLVFVPFSLIVN